jgi:hypothetical protein
MAAVRGGRRGYARYYVNVSKTVSLKPPVNLSLWCRYCVAMAPGTLGASGVGRRPGHRTSSLDALLIKQPWPAYNLKVVSRPGRSAAPRLTHERVRQQLGWQ